MNHGQTRIHKTHHGPALGEATIFPLIVFSILGHGAYTEMSFCFRTPNLGVLKFLKLGLSQLWGPITLCADLWLKWGLKQSCNPCQDLFNNMWDITCTQRNQGDYWLLVIRSQIANLIPNLFFCHNLCFKYSNGSCKPNLNIYILRDFQWYKEFINPMIFYLFNCFLKI
jgi:hypothetical protein